MEKLIRPPASVLMDHPSLVRLSPRLSNGAVTAPQIQKAYISDGSSIVPDQPTPVEMGLTI